MSLSFLEENFPKKVIKTFTIRHVRPKVCFVRSYKINALLDNLNMVFTHAVHKNAVQYTLPWLFTAVFFLLFVLDPNRRQIDLTYYYEYKVKVRYTLYNKLILYNTSGYIYLYITNIDTTNKFRILSVR